MTTLNLIYPQYSTIPYTVRTFPDGQPHIKLLATEIHTKEPVQLITRMSNPNDFLLALYATEALRQYGNMPIELIISYLTTARMDRQMTPGEAFSLSVTAQLINSMDYKAVYIFDPHSAVTTQLIHRSHAILNDYFAADVVHDILEKFSIQAGQLCVVIPDAGAAKKIQQVLPHLPELQVVLCTKKRDDATGALSGFEVHTDTLYGKHCFILDDILDGGGTFAGIAQLLKQKEAGNIFIGVSHGIFSKGFDLPLVKHIYTTDSFKSFTNLPDTVTVFEVQKYLQHH